MPAVDQRRARKPAEPANIEPLREFLEAQRLYQVGDDEGSLAMVSRAMGSDVPLERIAGRLGKVFGGGPLSDAALRVALGESRRRN